MTIGIDRKINIKYIKDMFKKVKEWFRHNRLLKSMLINKILIGVVPIIIFTIFLLLQFANANDRNFIEQQTNSVKSYSSFLSVQYESLVGMTRKVERDSLIMESDKEKINIEAVDELKKIVTLDGFYDYIWVKLYGAEYMYSPSSTSKITDFNSDTLNTFKFENYTNAELHTYLETIESPAIMQTQNINTTSTQFKKYMVVLMPLKTHGVGKTLGVMLAFVSEQTLFSALGGKSEQYGTLLINDDGETFYDGWNKATKSMIDEVLPKRNENLYISIPHYEVFLSEASFGGLNICRFVSTKYAREALIFNNTLTLVLVIICILWITGLIIISTIREYYPIRNISRNLKELIASNKNNQQVEIDVKSHKPNKEFDEIRILKQTFDHLKAINYSPVQKVHTELGSNNLRAVIFEGAVHELNLEHFNCHVVMCLKADNVTTKEFCDKLKKAANKTNVEFLDHDDKLLIIASYDSNSELNHLLENITNVLDKHFGENGTYKLSIGKTRKHVAELNKSFYDADFALQYMEGKGKEGVFSSELIEIDEAKDSKETVSLLAKLDMAFRLSNQIMIERTIIEIKEFLTKESTGLENCRTIFLFTKNALMSSLKKNMMAEDYAKLNELTGSITTDVNAMSIMIESLYERVCGLNTIVDKDGGFDKVAVLDYTDKKYLESEFSLNLISQYFKYSPSLFSRYFKENFNIGFKEYVDSLKMQKAKEWLESTKMGMDEISLKLNYSNASNFLRAFKQTFGVTPGQYRDRKR